MSAVKGSNSVKGEGESFSRATRRLLFGSEKRPVSTIPGEGTSAAASPERHVRVKVTMNIDGDIVAFFKNWAKGDGRRYQTLMNQVLREYIEGSRPERLAREVAALLADDPEFLKSITDRIGGFGGEEENPGKAERSRGNR